MARKPYGPGDVAAYAKERAANDFACVFGHTGYLIDLGGPASDNRDRSIKSLIQEIELATQLGLPFLVLHPARIWARARLRASTKSSPDWTKCFAATKRSPVAHRTGNTTGHGTCLGNKIEHLAAVFDRVKKPERLGLCLDTAHFFAAGYDIRTSKGWNAAIREVGSLVGLKQSPGLPPERLQDRARLAGGPARPHRPGRIGKEAFRHIVNDARFKKHPGCLETPKSDDLHEDVQNLATLRALAKTGSTSRRIVLAPAPPVQDVIDRAGTRPLLRQPDRRCFPPKRHA